VGAKDGMPVGAEVGALVHCERTQSAHALMLPYKYELQHAAQVQPDDGSQLSSGLLTSFVGDNVGLELGMVVGDAVGA
jgi:hypothetical protein